MITYKHAAAAMVALSASAFAHADFIGFYVGGGGFNPTFSGTFNSTDPIASEIDTEADLGLDEEMAKYAYLAIEHPIPLIPNVKVARTELRQSGSSTTTRSLSFGGKNYDSDTTIDSTVDLSHTDATIYYEFLDNWINLDLGITLRKFDGEIKLTGSQGSATQTAEQTLDFPVPLVYGKVRFDLPFTGLYAAVEGNWIGYDGDAFFDANAKLGYETGIGLGVEGGLRTITLNIDDVDDLGIDMDFTGIFVGAFYHF